jgi:ketosteroid isomerase-like protein
MQRGWLPGWPWIPIGDYRLAAAAGVHGPGESRPDHGRRRQPRLSDQSDPALAERFYLAWRDADYNAVGDLLAPDAQWIMTGRSRFAGTREGREASIEMRRLISELTGGTWRALRDDSYDIVSSEHHSFAVDRFLAERDGKQLDSHEAILVLAEGSRVKTLLHYFFDQHHFDDFWS